jgi:hypothetical protein
MYSWLFCGTKSKTKQSIAPNFTHYLSLGVNCHDPALASLHLTHVLPEPQQSRLFSKVTLAALQSRPVLPLAEPCAPPSEIM